MKSLVYYFLAPITVETIGSCLSAISVFENICRKLIDSQGILGLASRAEFNSYNLVMVIISRIFATRYTKS